MLIIKKKARGLTLLEVLLGFLALFAVVAIVYIGIFLTLAKGNFWYTDEGVLRELRAKNPTVTEVMKTSRSIFSRSLIEVRLDNGNISQYWLDTDILWNYEFSESK